MVLSTTIAGPGVVSASEITSLFVKVRPSELVDTVVVTIDRKPLRLSVSRNAQLSMMKPGAAPTKNSVAIDRKLPMNTQF